MSSLRKFNPGSLDNDVFVKTVRGLGRGRGFEVIEERSALQDEDITEPIKERTLDLLHLFLVNNITSKDEISQKLDLVSVKDLQALEEDRGSLRANLEDMQNRLNEQLLENKNIISHLENRDRIFSGRIKELIELVEDELDEDSEDWGDGEEDNEYNILKIGLERLIESHGALRASSEEDY